MWNDEEDNNPYGTSFDRRDSQTSSSVNPTSPTTRDSKFFISGLLGSAALRFNLVVSVLIRLTSQSTPMNLPQRHRAATMRRLRLAKALPVVASTLQTPLRMTRLLSASQAGMLVALSKFSMKIQICKSS